METNNVNDDNMVENPGWQEADQLVFSNATEEQQLQQITEGLEPATIGFQVQRPNLSATR